MRDLLSPLISIIIPTYNRADLISKAIQSVIDQSYKNWELIVVDNYSDDNTKEVIEAFNDDRILMLFTPRTGSVAASRNLGVSYSKGEWIAFLDSDDWWFPNKLECVHNVIQKQPDLIYHDLQIVALDGTLLGRKSTRSRKLKDPLYLDLLLNGNDIALSSVVVRRQIFLEVNGMNESPAFFAVEDYDTWLRIAQITNRFVHIPKVLGAYQLHSGNIGKINNFQYLSEAFKNHLDLLGPKQLRRFQSLYTYQIARSKYRGGKFSEITEELVFVIKFGRPQYVLRALIMLLSNLLFRRIRP
jgi:glycosyltransferase involved in cell wall biosynthesis